MKDRDFKKEVRTIVFASVSILSLFILFSVNAVHGSAVFGSSFDALYPTSPYKKVLDASMGVLGYLYMFQDEPTMTEREITVVYDALIGRMARACTYAEGLVDECKKGLPLLVDDVAYLVDIFHDIEKVYHTLAPRHHFVDLDIKSLHVVREQLITLIPSF